MSTQDWPDTQTARIGKVLQKLRKDQKRSAQWVADRTKELGYEVTRTAITDLEIGRRKHITLAELTVLARALNTSPTALTFPGPYDGTVEVLPGFEVVEIRAVQWFSGLPLGHTERVHPLADEFAEYHRNLKRLRLAREVWNLEESGITLRARMMGDRSDDERTQLVDALADLERRIAEAKADDAW